MMSPRFPVSLEDLPCEWRIGFLRSHEMLLLTEHNDRPQTFHTIRDDPQVPEGAVTATSLRSSSHPNGVMFYRIAYQGKSMVFATDTEAYIGGDQNLVEFARGADLLIHDAEYTNEEYIKYQSWGHSSWRMAIEVARQAGVKRLALTHHNAMHDDDFLDALSEQAKEEYADAFFARENMAIELLD
jgi:ribonuclease BN (tRNA processing enzyme)